MIILAVSTVLWICLFPFPFYILYPYCFKTNKNIIANLATKLCDFVPEYNYFTNNISIQINDTAMSTCMASPYANIATANLNIIFLVLVPETSPLSKIHWQCLLTSGLNGKESLEKFHQDFNNFHPSIKLSLSEFTHNFLGTTAQLLKECTSSMRNSPIITHMYVPPASHRTYHQVHCLQPNFLIIEFAQKKIQNSWNLVKAFFKV